MNGCICADCGYVSVYRDDYGNFHYFCSCIDSEFYQKEISIEFGECDFGIVDVWESVDNDCLYDY